MDFEQALVYELQTIIGVSGRVFPQKAEENMKPPFIVYLSSDGERIMALSGPTDMTELNCELHIWGESYDQLKTLTKAVIDQIMSFFQRTIGQDGPKIKSISHLEPVEDIDNNLNYYKSSFDIRVRY